MPSASTSEISAGADQLSHANEVRLVGRVAAAAEARELPSGDVLVAFRLVVERPAEDPTRARRRAPTVDTLDCAAWQPGVRRSVVRWAEGDVVEVIGSLRRRFWRGASGAASRTEVEVRRARRLRRGER